MSSTPIQVYDSKWSGLLSPRHVITSEGAPVGVLEVKRQRGLIVGGEFRPEKGEVLFIRRDPGLARSQFSLWTDGREWLGSSLRWTSFAREVAISNGNKPFRLLPVEGWGFGWSLYAPKSGENARIVAQPLRGTARLEVYRRLDFPLLLFSYFLGAQILWESFLPGPEPEKVKSSAAATAV
ncbi:MAG: hypothetical protein GC161_09300 [Planctomycetaceae bacterium]|nr:hypothetical protein [Planctomycetaceae bacterium]